MNDNWQPLSVFSTEYQQRKLILTHLLRCPRLLQGTWDRISDLGLFLECPFMQMIWDATLDYYSNYHRPIPEAVLKYELAQLCQAMGVEYLPLDAQVSVIYSESMVLDEQYIANMLQQLLAEHARRTLGLQVQSGSNLDTLLSQIKETEYALRTHPLSRIDSTDLSLIDPDHLLDLAPRFAVNIPWLDAAVGGGMKEGELMGLIMPTGVGKTTMGWQINKGCVERGEDVVLQCFEQYLQGDQALRMYVLISDATRADWDRGYRNVPAEVRARYVKQAPLWGKHLRVFDRWIDPEVKLNDVADLFRPIDELRREGFNPKVLCLDWWGAMTEKMRSYPQFARMTDNQFLGTTHKWITEIKHYLVEYKMRGFVWQQKSGAASGKAKNYVGSSHDAQSDRSWSNRFDYCWVSSDKCTDSEVIFRLDKARGMPCVTVTVKLDGERCRFDRDALDSDSELITAIEEKPKFTVSSDEAPHPTLES